MSNKGTTRVNPAGICNVYLQSGTNAPAVYRDNLPLICARQLLRDIRDSYARWGWTIESKPDTLTVKSSNPLQEGASWTIR